jgi:hypothetical protein
MPCAADDELGISDETPRHGRQAVDTILTDADEREPSLRGSAHEVTSGMNACGF